MGNAFDDVVFDWHGKEYRIPANRMLGAIARVEDVITMGQLGQHTQRGTPPVSKVAQAYGAVLRYAGVRVTDDEVYCGMFANGDLNNAVTDAVNSLFHIMMPPAARARMAALEHIEPEEVEAAPANPPAAAPAS